MLCYIFLRFPCIFLICVILPLNQENKSFWIVVQGYTCNYRFHNPVVTTCFILDDLFLWVFAPWSIQQFDVDNRVYVQHVWQSQLAILTITPNRQNLKGPKHLIFQRLARMFRPNIPSVKHHQISLFQTFHYLPLFVIMVLHHLQQIGLQFHKVLVHTGHIVPILLRYRFPELDPCWPGHMWLKSVNRI